MKLQEIRKRKNLTQQEVAEALNIPRQKLSRYEIDQSDPSIDTLIKLANFYETTIDNLVGYSTPYSIDTSSLTLQQQRLFNKIKELPPNLCERVDSYIVGLLTAEEEKQRTINQFKRGIK